MSKDNYEIKLTRDFDVLMEKYKDEPETVEMLRKLRDSKLKAHRLQKSIYEMVAGLTSDDEDDDDDEEDATS